MVQLVQIVDQLLGAHLSGLGSAVDAVVALSISGVQGQDLGLLVALLLKQIVNGEELAIGTMSLDRVSGRPTTENYVIA